MAEEFDVGTHHSLRLSPGGEQGKGKKKDRPAKPDGPFIRASAREAYASTRTLVTFGSTVMPGPNVVATVAFWM